MSVVSRALSRAFKKRTRQHEGSLVSPYSHATFETYPYLATPSYARANNNDDDASSISSFSTTATADNLPGTGRLLDKYFFQPMGKKIETLAMRVTISTLSPAHISRYIESGFKNVDACLRNMPISDVLAQTSRFHNGSICIAGLKSLVKQTR